MEPEGHLARYPTSSVLTDVTYQASEAALSESLESSPRQPPAYGDERAPPQYQEEAAGGAKAKAKARRTKIIRLMTSILIAVLVSLIVAAVVQRIHEAPRGGEKRHEQQAESAETEKYTVMSPEPSSVPKSTAKLMADADGAAAARPQARIGHVVEVAVHLDSSA